MSDFTGWFKNFNHTVIDKQVFINADCTDVLECIPEESVDVVVTSPPYNLNIKYNTYIDNLSKSDYFKWTELWISRINKVLSSTGSFFLNVAGSVSKPHIPWKILEIALKFFVLQNQIIWVKSIFIEESVHINSIKECVDIDSLINKSKGHSFGHFKPINSQKFLNNTHEFVFHLTKHGDVHLHKEDIGVPYVHPSNLHRWKHKRTKRCQGNVWFLPYDTRCGSAKHPAQFPEALVSQSLILHGNGKLVLDPFGGSGTTAVVCSRLNLDCISVELDGVYHGLSIQRRRDRDDDSFRNIPTKSKIYRSYS